MSYEDEENFQSDHNEEQEDMEESEEPAVPDLKPERFGGAQAAHGEDEDEEAKRKLEERERKKAEVRKRLEEAGRAKKAKKGFLTPERKKKLRKLLMMKAAEDLKQQQLLKEQERNRILQERIIPLPNVDSINNQTELEKIARQFHQRISELEDVKYDLEFLVRIKDLEINELTIQVNDLRGKFVKPTLKKVSKYDNKFKTIKKPETANFRENLKVVKKDKFSIDDLKSDKKEDKPQWAGKGPEAEEKPAAPVEAAEPAAVEAEE